MAKDAANSVGPVLLSLDTRHKPLLAQIRHWGHLKVGVDGDTLWVKDISGTEAASAQVRSIPFISIYHMKEGLLFPEGSLLPSRKMPALLWTPIEQALPLVLPALNHNFFGLDEKIALRLVPSSEERDAVAMLASLQTLSVYMEIAPAVRLEGIQWCFVSPGNQALLSGFPLLPVTGTAFWQSGDMLLPCGYEPEFPFLSGDICHKIQGGADALICWITPDQYILIPRQYLKPLTRSSFRKSFTNMAP